MDSPDIRDRSERRLYYIHEQRCKLCRFRCIQGERILVVLPTGRVSQPFKYNVLFSREIVDGGRMYPIAMRAYHPNSRVIDGFHASCYRSCSPLPIPNSRTPDVFVYTYKRPYFSFEKEREKRIRDPLALRLKAKILKRLPLELCGMVAEYLTRECAAVTLQAIARKASPPPPDEIIDVHQDVYATYMDIEGLMYVQSLSNTSPKAGDKSGHQVLRWRKNEAIQKVYVAWDRLGVRSISIASRQDDSRPTLRHPGGVFWTEYEAKEGKLLLMAVSDGLKLRRVQSAEPIPRSRPLENWCVRKVICHDATQSFTVLVPQSHDNEAAPKAFGELPPADDASGSLQIHAVNKTTR